MKKTPKMTNRNISKWAMKCQRSVSGKKQAIFPAKRQNLTSRIAMQILSFAENICIVYSLLFSAETPMAA